MSWVLIINIWTGDFLHYYYTIEIVLINSDLFSLCNMSKINTQFIAAICKLKDFLTSLISKWFILLQNGYSHTVANKT